MGNPPDDPTASPSPGLDPPTGSVGPGGGSETLNHPPGEPDPTEQIEPGLLPEVPGYEVEGELGRGGMGVVYRARQHGLNRTVALKMVLAGAAAKTDDLIRFLAEAETAARLQHHGIAQIFDTGRVGGLPYFTMEYVDGGSLADRLEGGALPPADAARVALQLAEAVAHAHAAGIVHRDLKPANILLTADATPKITDFGLAKRLEAGDGLTRTGSILGTPAYMPPEQARGDLKGVGPLGDVYALGAILYAMLTGRPPFRSDSPVSTLSLVLNTVPEKPRSVVRAVPRDLETIALKCLEKDPARRYASADALADDLRRFLEGRTIRARQATAAEKLRRWARRNPAVASLLTAVFVVLTAGVVVSSVLAVRAADGARDARDAQGRAEANAEETRQAERVAREAEGVAKAAERERTEQLWRSQIERARAGRTSGRVGQRFDGLAALRQAAAYRPTLEIRNEAIACMALVDVRPAPPGTPRPDGYGGTYDNTLANSDLRDPGSGRRGLRKGPSLDVMSAEGKMEVSLRHPDELRGVVWRPDGKILAAGCEDMGIHVWRMPSGVRQTVLHGQGAAYNLAFSPSGRFLCSYEIGGTVRFWDAITGRQLLWSNIPNTPHRFGTRDDQLPGSSPWQLAPADECRVLHHSLTGARDGTGPLHRAITARFDPTGKRIVTCGREAVFWDPETGAELARVPDATGGQALFLSTGEWVTSSDRAIRRWPAVPPYEPLGAELFATQHRAPDWARPVRAVSGDGAWVAVVEYVPGSVTLVPTSTDAEPVRCPQPGAFDAAFSPDGRFLATSSVGTAGVPVRVWEVPSGRRVHEFPGTAFACTAFTPDGWLVISTSGGFTFWKIGTWEQGRQFALPSGRSSPMAFSPDGRMLACRPEPLTVKLLDPTTGSELATLTSPVEAHVEDLCFSPDGTKLVVSTGTAVAYLWDLRLVRRQLREMNLDWDPPLP